MAPAPYLMGTVSGLGVRGVRGGTPTPTPTPTPSVAPTDWRMPASVSTSSGLSGAQSALASAQDTAASKSRPSVNVTDGATEYIEWTVSEAGEALLSFIPRSTTGTFTVTLDGVDQSFVKAIPGGTSEQDRRQAQVMTVTAGQTIRLTVSASGGACAIEPLLHLIPVEGPWDAHLLIGPSTLQDGYKSSQMEASIIAAFATRDPVCFNYARTGYTIAQIDGITDQALVHFGSAARYAWCSDLLANDIANDAPDAAKIASRTASMTSIFDKLEGAGLIVGMGSNRYVKFSGNAVPAIQTTGAKPYDTAITFPFIQSRIPYCWNGSIARPHSDKYLLGLYYRADYADYIHSGTTQYGRERAHDVDSWFRYLYTGSWSHTAEIERIVALAETASTVEATALTAYTEGDYAVIGLDAGTPKNAYRARLDAIYPTVLFFEAKRLIAIAELSTSPADKATAQAALDAAETAGYIDAASPNTIAEQQARIDAIVAASFDQILRIDFGGNVESTGWNNIVPTGNITTPTSYPLVDDTGAATDADYTIELFYLTGASDTGFATGSQIEEFPDPRLGRRLVTSNGAGLNGKFTGLVPGRTYDLVAVATGVNSVNRRTGLQVNGTLIPGDMSDLNLTTTPWRVSGIVADANGEIDVDFVRGTGSTYTYPVGLVLKRVAA